jgi:N-acetylmuramate 1-kinase
LEIGLQRLQEILSWLEGLYPGAEFELLPASIDASFRRYFRVCVEGRSRIVMDAPPQFEDCRAFIHVAGLFRDAGVHVPLVLQQDLRQGFLLLTDLGVQTYLQALRSANGDELYAAAFAALIEIQRASRPGVLPDYSEALLLRELELFPEWYVTKHLGVTLGARQRKTLDATFALLLADNLAQPHVFVHRDYHSRNLMVSDPNPGILDFQDAVFGPITYDAVSLLKDAYMEWDEEQVLDWLVRYWQLARRAGLPVAADFGEFFRAFEWMGVQRHLKILGIFSRLSHRDGKDGYLRDLPLVLRHLRKTCGRYRELTPLLGLLDELESHPLRAGYTF